MPGLIVTAEEDRMGYHNIKLMKGTTKGSTWNQSRAFLHVCKKSPTLSKSDVGTGQKKNEPRPVLGIHSPNTMYLPGNGSPDPMSFYSFIYPVIIFSLLGGFTSFALRRLPGRCSWILTSRSK